MHPPGIYKSVHGRQSVRNWCRRRLASWSTPHEVRVVPTCLGETALVTAGRGAGVPVLLLPGTNFCAATMLAAADALAPGRRVVLADLPGQPGLSAARRPGRDRMAAYGRWADEVVALVATGPLVVAGHSLGAAVALAAAPGPLVAGLVLLSPAGLSRARLTPTVLSATLPWLAAPSQARSRALLRSMSGRRPLPDEVGGALAEWLTLVGYDVRTSLAPPPLPAETVRRWAGTPLVVATGTGDCFFPPSRLADPAGDLLGARPVPLQGLGHLAPHEDPEALPALLDRLRDGPPVS